MHHFDAETSGIISILKKKTTSTLVHYHKALSHQMVNEQNPVALKN
jgi:hypothetical protein